MVVLISSEKWKFGVNTLVVGRLKVVEVSVLKGRGSQS